MTYIPVPWAPRDPVIASKLQQMSDNESYIQQQVDNKMPKGILAMAKRITPITGIVSGGSTILSGLAATITVPAGRVIEVEFYVRSWQADVDSVTVGQQIFRDSGLVNERNVYLPVLNLGLGGGSCKVVEELAAGTYTYEGGVQPLTWPSPPTIMLNAAADRYAFIKVTDIGSTSGISIVES